jgi:hypothetical protein
MLIRSLTLFFAGSESQLLTSQHEPMFGVMNTELSGLIQHTATDSFCPVIVLSMDAGASSKLAGVAVGVCPYCLRLYKGSIGIFFTEIHFPV